MHNQPMKKLLILGSLICLTLLPRLVLCFFFFGTPDTLNAMQSIDVFKHGQNVYAASNYTYPPLWLAILLGLDFLSANFHIPFYIVIRFPAIIFDVFLALLIFAVFKKYKKNDKDSFIGALFFSLNPISILISGYHGQIDNIWIFLSLVSWYIFEYFSKTVKNIIICAILLSFGVLLKVFPVLFVPLFVLKLKGKIKKTIFTVIAVLPTALIMLWLLVKDFSNVSRAFVNYAIEHDFWGISAIISFIHYHLLKGQPFDSIYRLMITPQWERLGLYAVLIVVYTLLYKQRKTFKISRAMFLLMLAVLVFTPFISVQWWVWLIPLGIVAQVSWRKIVLYTIIITMVLLTRYYLFLLNIPVQLRPWEVHDVIFGFKLYSLIKIPAFLGWITCLVWFFKFSLNNDMLD